jgi:hypothetical protein
MAVKFSEKNGGSRLFAGVALLALVGTAHAESIQQWQTPTGSLYFGDRPPAGSTLVGTTETLGTSGGGDVARAALGRTGKHARRPAVGVERDSRGRIKRSSSARRHFLRSQGFTHTPPGCQVDHVVPLAKGGADTPANMQLLCGDPAPDAERRGTTFSKQHLAFELLTAVPPCSGSRASSR